MRNRIAEYDIRPQRSAAAESSAARLKPGNSAGSKSTLERAADLVGEYPYAALAAAAITGIIVGWLVKRR